MYSVPISLFSKQNLNLQRDVLHLWKMSLCLILPETTQALQNVIFPAKEHVFKSTFYKM